MIAVSVVRPRHVDIALLLLRLALAAVFIFHGSQKLFTMGIGGVTGGFNKFGVPLPAVTGPVISILEFGGGIAMLLGLFTRPIACLLACDMLGAMAFVHFKNGFSMPTGYEFTLTLFCMAAALAFAGAGAFSVDGLRPRR